MKTYYEKFLVGTATLVVVLLPVTSGAQFLGEPNLPGVQSNYAAQALPPHYTSGLIPATDNMPPDNQLTNSIATLGRVLFYDPRLSVNDTVSCSSCHQQVFNFSDPNQLSQGVAGLTQRNAPSLANARYYIRGFFFWDERAPSLEAQVLMPIQSAVEMGGMDLITLEVKLQETSFYPNLFQQAFGSPAVTANGVSMALAQFVRSMVSYRSKYDQGVANNFSNFTAQEQQGRDLFNGRAGCSNCHMTDAQIMDAPHNIGLDSFDTDPGAGGGTFKAPRCAMFSFRLPICTMAVSSRSTRSCSTTTTVLVTTQTWTRCSAGQTVDHNDSV